MIYYDYTFFLAVIMVEFVQPLYTFVENKSIGIIQVRKSTVSYAQFQIRVLGGELNYQLLASLYNSALTFSILHRT